MKSIRTGSADEIGIPIEDIAAFYDRHWPRKIALGLPSFAKWQFVDAPEQQGRCSVCVSVAGSELIGAMGLHEHRFSLEGREAPAAELTTWIVAPAAKGKGIGPRMLDFLQERYEVLLGSGISDEALNVYLRKGFNYWRYIPRVFRIFDLKAVEPYSRIDPLGRKLAMHRMNAIGPDTSSARRIAAADIADPHAALQGKNAYVRDRDYFEWRFDRHPVFAYETYAVGNSAYVILRRDEIPGMSFAHVAELLARPEDMPHVLSFLDGYAQEQGLAAIDFTCTSSELVGHFIASGWFSSVDEPMFAFLSLFHPPELRDPQTTSLIYWARGRQAALADLGRMHVVKADLDLDRPTGAYYEARGLEQR
ncbi:MAG TPA: GNAT family N-acetyltransferase [Allosphingosinicella sp.]|uniref:GNAT family N-acetyltransferase n=1 Tax=Allosphingosinicella sp. TaxID=2823234 RepID=UPI002ED9DE41